MTRRSTASLRSATWSSFSGARRRETEGKPAAPETGAEGAPLMAKTAASVGPLTTSGIAALSASPPTGEGHTVADAGGGDIKSGIAPTVREPPHAAIVENMATLEKGAP